MVRMKNVSDTYFRKIEQQKKELQEQEMKLKENEVKQRAKEEEFNQGLNLREMT